MASSGKKRIWVSNGPGWAVTAKRTYNIINDVIKKFIVRSPYTYDAVVYRMMEISSSSFRNYLKGPQEGRISQHTAEKLSDYTGLPFELFCGAIEMTEQDQEIIHNRLLQDFPRSEDKSTEIIEEQAEQHPVNIEARIISIMPTAKDLVAVYDQNGVDIKFQVIGYALNDRGEIYPLKIDKSSAVVTPVINQDDFKFLEWEQQQF